MRRQRIARIASMSSALRKRDTTVHRTLTVPAVRSMAGRLVLWQSAINGRKRRSNMENFKVGDTVQWVSSANGFWKEKKGIVESVIPAGGNPQIYATRVAEKYGRKTPHLGYPRDHVSYIVRVPSKTGGVGKFYRPHVALLEMVDE